MTSEDRDDEKIMQDARLLATGIAPERDLWPAIESAISEPQARRRSAMPWYAQAAAVLILAGGSSGLTWLVMQEDTDVVNGAAVANNVELDAEFASFGDNYSLSASYSDAHSNLAAELDVELERLPPEVRVAVEQNLTIIRDAIREINAELTKDPDNRLLQQLLLQSYHDELAMMRDVGELTRDVLSRNDI